MSDIKSNDFTVEKSDMNDIASDLLPKIKQFDDIIAQYTQLAIKYTFTLNGAAAIAVTTMFTEIFLKKPDLSKYILESISFFIIGAAFSLIAIFLLLIIQISNKQSLLSLIAFVNKMHDFFSCAENNVQKELLNKKYKSINKSEFWFVIIGYISIGLNVFSMIMVGCSLYFFGLGINNSLDVFVNEINSESHPKNQINICEASYPECNNILISPTKP